MTAPTGVEHGTQRQEASSLRLRSGQACPAGELPAQVVMVSALPWAGVPHRQHELAAGLARRLDCIYLEPPRGPSWRARGMVTEWPGASGRRQAPFGFAQGRPAQLGEGPEFGGEGPAARPRVARTATPVPKRLWYLSAAADRLRFRLAWQAVARDLAQTPGRPRLLWVDGGSSAPAIAAVPHDLLVYDCVDLDWAYSHFAPRRAALRAWHELLLARADLVFFSMGALCQEQQARRGGCHFVPNACSQSHFAADLACPAPLRPLPWPRLGFVGAMLARRFDCDLIANLARHHPEWHFPLVGEADQAVRAALAGLENVHLLGRQPHPEMPAYLAHFDVCLLPNRVDTELSYCFPKKLWEYLAAGKPVVSTAIPEALPLQGLVRVGHTRQEFARQVQAALMEEADPASAAQSRARRRELAQENTWDQRVEQIVQILRVELGRRGIVPRPGDGESHHA